MEHMLCWGGGGGSQVQRIWNYQPEEVGDTGFQLCANWLLEVGAKLVSWDSPAGPQRDTIVHEILENTHFHRLSVRRDEMIAAW